MLRLAKYQMSGAYVFYHAYATNLAMHVFLLYSIYVASYDLLSYY